MKAVLYIFLNIVKLVYVLASQNLVPKDKINHHYFLSLTQESISLTMVEVIGGIMK